MLYFYAWNTILIVHSVPVRSGGLAGNVRQLENALERIINIVDTHMVDALVEIWERRDRVKGLEFTYEPKVLRHFLCRLRSV